MNFKEWLLSEVVDIRQQDTSNINLERTSAGFKYRFNHAGADFSVSFDLTTTDDYDLPHIYNINFLGPNGYKTTGQSGTAASIIYTQLLLAVKKLFETTPVNGLYFSPAEPQMALIYRRFFNQYLKKDFMQVNHSIYLRKDALRELLRAKQPKQREADLRNILTNRRDVNDIIKETERRRLLKLQLKKRLHNFVRLTSSNRLGYLYDINNTGSAMIITQDSKGRFSKDYFLPHKIDLTPQPENDIKEFLEEIIDLKNNEDVRSFFRTDQHLVNWLTKYGLEYQEPATVMKNYVNKFYQEIDYSGDKIIAYIYEAQQSFWDEDDYSYLGLNDINQLVDHDTFSIRRVHRMEQNVSENDIINFLKNLASPQSRTSAASEVLKDNEKLKELIKQYGIELQ